jgi:hypothetical protein
MSLVVRIGINQDALVNLISQILPSIFLERYANYLTPLEQQTVGGTFIKPIREIYGFFIQLALILMWWLGRKLVTKDELIMRVIAFSLLCCCILNILSIIPSVGRFSVLIYYFYFISCLAFLVFHREMIKSDMMLVIVMSILVFSVDFAAVLMTEGIMIVSVASIISPLFLAPLFVLDNMSLFEFFNR